MVMVWTVLIASSAITLAYAVNLIADLPGIQAFFKGSSSENQKRRIQQVNSPSALKEYAQGIGNRVEEWNIQINQTVALSKSASKPLVAYEILDFDRKLKEPSENCAKMVTWFMAWATSESKAKQEPKIENVRG